MPNAERRVLPPAWASGDDAFCIYCQHQYTRFSGLQKHLRREHMGTYAQINLAPIESAPAGTEATS